MARSTTQPTTNDQRRPSTTSNSCVDTAGAWKYMAIHCISSTFNLTCNNNNKYKIYTAPWSFKKQRCLNTLKRFPSNAKYATNARKYAKTQCTQQTQTKRCHCQNAASKAVFVFALRSLRDVRCMGCVVRRKFAEIVAAQLPNKRVEHVP